MPDTALRFICDSMLGRLAKSLRMLGFDTLYTHCLTPQQLVQLSMEQQRIILTRRSACMQSSPTVSCIYIRSNDPDEQLRQVIAASGIVKALIRPFTICLSCNVPLTGLAKEAAAGRVPDYVFTTVDNFAACNACGRVYWKGTHYANMEDRMKKIMV
ncbi:MAG: Mut7-C RNAse domain-containing protein [Deltaproteobacteria bacterium]|nr:Mut7-C RNAse domain-containing protein [Deltaproteobacteria bacterium]